MEQGIVIKSTGSWYSVKTQNQGVVKCRIRGNYRIKGIRATNPVTVGDRVEIGLIDHDGTAIIEKILPRVNYMIRRSSNLSKDYQLIAANIDQAVIIASLVSPRTFLEFIDRFLVTAQAYRIPSGIVFNKTDLYDQKLTGEMDTLVKLYEGIGYPCFSVSALNGKGLVDLERWLSGKTSLISGNSGVGKSTILNRLYPSLLLKTGEISDFHQTGKHTTTFAEMYEPSPGTRIIDTPGIRGYGVVEFDKAEIFHFYPEIFECSADCQFHNCLHTHEPGCAVKEAVQNGKISASRYQSYLSLLEPDESKYR